MTIKYDHSQNTHTLAGPRVALPYIFPTALPKSVLDVGCGQGTWLKAFHELGVTDVFGIDGVPIPDEKLHFPASKFKVLDLTKPWSVGRKFEAAICLEVAEHLPPSASHSLVAALCEHAPLVVFSAAAPHQPGQNHINCNWPSFWQGLFNEFGFECLDSVRPAMWFDDNVEAWYRQNLFIAKSSKNAGKEPRLRGGVHPEFLELYLATAAESARQELLARVQKGDRPFAEYVKMASTAFSRKFKRRLGISK